MNKFQIVLITLELTLKTFRDPNKDQPVCILENNNEYYLLQAGVVATKKQGIVTYNLAGTSPS